METSKLLSSSPHTNVNNIEDRLNNLPESLLHHILSFLDMKFVVETSLLSKSWRSLWTTLPFLNLSFEYDFFSDEPQRFVEEFFSRRESSNLVSFRYHTDFTARNDIIIIRLIHLALQCNPIELHLNIQRAKVLSPIWPCIFTPNTLRSMELDICRNPLYETPFPDKIDLPLLASFCLRSFRRLTNTFLEKLFSGCPVLVKLEVVGCRFLQDERVIISSLRLKHLKIDKGRLKFNRDNCRITISTPNLISLQCRDYSSRKYYFYGLSSLVTAHIDLTTLFKGEENDAHLVKKYFEGVPDVNNLLPNFRVVLNQKYLEISFMIFKGQFQVAIDILKDLHNIHTLVIGISRRKGNSLLLLGYFLPEMTEYKEEEFCFENLKHIVFRNAQGFVYELALLKILLKCATTLEKVTIFTSKKVFAGKEIKHQSLREKLLSYPRASPNAEILLC